MMKKTWMKWMTLLIVLTLAACSDKEVAQQDEVAPEVEQEVIQEEDLQTNEISLQPLTGYYQERDGLTVCQLTEEALICGIISVDAYAYAPIESVSAITDDEWDLQLTDGTHITFSNVTDETFQMFGTTYVKTAPETIHAQLPYMPSLDDYFNIDVIQTTLETAQGQGHDLLEEWRQAEANEAETNSDTTLFPNYTNEEIEYARMWHDYGKSDTPPRLTVSFYEAGTYINPYIEDSRLVYPEKVVVLTGEITGHGMVIYSSNEDGTVNLYDVPSHWHQDSEASMKRATEQVLQTVTTREVPDGDPIIVGQILHNMTIEH